VVIPARPTAPAHSPQWCKPRVQPKGTIVIAMAGGDGNGGPRPRLAGSGELSGGATLSAGPGSIDGSRQTRDTREGRG
jgi:hypothetical protein